jgi:hypothetical protein
MMPPPLNPHALHAMALVRAWGYLHDCAETLFTMLPESAGDRQLEKRISAAALEAERQLLDYAIVLATEAELTPKTYAQGASSIAGHAQHRPIAVIYDVIRAHDEWALLNAEGAESAATALRVKP